MAKIKRNDRCHCGSGLKYKKCCVKEDKVRPRGVFDPDLPISDKAGGVGNHLGGDGSWYVIRSGHGHGKTPLLKGERLDKANRMISEWNLMRAKKRRLGMGATVAAALAWTNVK